MPTRRLAAANNSLKQTTATAQQERERADDQRTKLHAAYASLREELDRYQSGFYRDVLAGAGQVAGVVLRSVAAARGIKLPSPETAAAVPAPAPPKTSKAAPPAKAADVRRWRKLWIPEQDHLVLAMREQIITEDELATAQAKHGMRVTAHRLPADADLTLLASYAALTARMEHFKKESKNQDYFRRSTWVHESYLLDSLSEISLQEAAINRRLELDSLARNLQYRRR
jgi:hypothetical protein